MQSPVGERASTMQQEVAELELLVSAAFARGIEPGRCREIIEENVRRARRKASMLPHFDSSLVLSTLEQAKSEIASLSDVTDTNAAVMQEELLHHQERAEKAATAALKGDLEDLAAASVQSVPGTSADATSSLGFPKGPASEEANSYGDAASSVASGGSLPKSPHGGGGGAGLSAADAVAAVRDLASEVASVASAEDDDQRIFRHALSLKASKSGDFRLAKSYDFETAVSPRAGYHIRDESFSFASAHPQEEEGLLVYSRTPAGDPRPGAVEPAEDLGQFMAMSQASMAAAEQGHPAVSTPPRAGRDTAAPWCRSGGNGNAGKGSGSGSGSGSPRCWGGVVPPGFNPLAEVEGGVSHEEDYEAIDPQSPTGVGDVDLLSYSSAPFTLHSVTPPRHVMEALAAEMQQLRM